MGLGAIAPPSFAQITPDASLGTLVNGGLEPCPTGACDITGGTRPGGSNFLFHSFDQFSIDSGGTATFRDLAGIETIFSRVRNERSLIDGLLATEAGSRANLFLINPNGIVFGPNAQLSLGGSFGATTANGIGFGTAGAFDLATTPAELGLLTVAPSAFLYSQIPQPIQVQAGAELVLADSLPGDPRPHELILAGGDVSVEGGTLRSPGGDILLMGSATPGRIETVDGITISPGATWADVSFSQGAIADVVAGGNGNLLIFADGISISDSVLCAGIGPQGSLCSSPGG
ncbi:MAG: filamentous hemagglutinin N-terminal domain-containing protein [Synechococcales cyanobacterium RM1_1_8]|nr:filamentous hemagglutinin N-terminal domain-containing protein [Synechococcales cyanobacterium RM1_1_8]